jgi:hypothetical protein
VTNVETTLDAYAPVEEREDDVVAGMGETVVARDAGGNPSVYAVLRADLHLEPLRLEDRERMHAALEKVRAAIGPQLRYSVNSKRGSRVVRHQPKHFADIDAWVVSLTPQTHQDTLPLLKSMMDTTGGPLTCDVSFKGAAEGPDAPGVASPWTLSLWGESTFTGNEGMGLEAHTLLSFSVPLAFSLGAFQNLVARVASGLRLRWGTAGLGYATWEYLSRGGQQQTHAHALANLGFDRGDHANHMAKLHEHIRSVGWIVVVGPALWARLPEENRRALATMCSVARVGECTWIRASEAPQNENGTPPAALVALDRLLRPIRLPSVVDDWSTAGLDPWLRRLER